MNRTRLALSTRLFAATICGVAAAACGSNALTVPHSCPQAGGVPGCPTGQFYAMIAERGANAIDLLPASLSLPARVSIAAPGAESFASELGVDTSGTLFAGEYPSKIATFAPGYTQPDGAITNGVDDPAALAIGITTFPNGSSGQALFVANRASNTIAVFDLSNTSKPAFTLNGVQSPDGLAFDAGRNLWISEAHDVVEIAAPVSGKSLPSTRITAGLQAPSGIAFDQSGTTMYVTDSRANAIAVYGNASAFPTAVVKSGLNDPGLPLVSGPADSGFIFVPNRGANTIVEYQLPLTSASKPSFTSSAPMDEPSALIFEYFPF